MGYLTDYTLTIRGAHSPSADEIISVLRDENEDAAFSLMPDGSTDCASKWYDCIDDMKEFSKRFPSHIFVLDGNGEDGEKMRFYFSDGKAQDAKPVVVYEEFDPSKLK